MLDTHFPSLRAVGRGFACISQSASTQKRAWCTLSIEVKYDCFFILASFALPRFTDFFHGVLSLRFFRDLFTISLTVLKNAYVRCLIIAQFECTSSAKSFKFGSGSVGSTIVWAFRIRIRYYLNPSGSSHSALLGVKLQLKLMLAKLNLKKILTVVVFIFKRKLISFSVVTCYKQLVIFKTDVNVPSIRNKKKITKTFSGILKPLKRRQGSRSGQNRIRNSLVRVRTTDPRIWIRGNATRIWKIAQKHKFFSHLQYLSLTVWKKYGMLRRKSQRIKIYRLGYRFSNPYPTVWFSFWKSQRFGKSLETFGLGIFILRFLKWILLCMIGCFECG